MLRPSVARYPGVVPPPEPGPLLVDPALDERLSELIARILGERPDLVPTRPGSPRVGLTSRHAVYLGGDERACRRIQLEGERLLWAARNGLPVPQLVERGPGWLVTERAPDDGHKRGRAYVEAALRAAAAIEGVGELPPGLPAGTPFRKPSRRVVAERTWRLLRGPVPLRDFVGLRRAFRSLPREVLAHGDFHPRNVLFNRGSGVTTVIDWEFVALAPRHSDLLLLWARLEERDDRQLVLEEVLKAGTDREQVALLHQWLAVRCVADMVTKLHPRDWPAERLSRSLERVAEASANAASWRGSRPPAR